MKVYFFYAWVLLLTASLLSMQISVKLDDGSVHTLELYEIESSKLLLQKKLLREKITPELVKKWGYDEASYKQLQQFPLFLENIDTSSLNLFRNALHIKQSEFVSYFNKLNSEQQNQLFDITSAKKLGVAQLIAQLSSCVLLPEIIDNCIAPHFLTKTIVDHMCNKIIIRNANNKTFTQITEKLSGDDVELRYNSTFAGFMMIPTALIKKNKYMFDGCVGKVIIKLEDQIWTRIIEYKRENGIRYIVTPCITDEACAQQEISRFPEDKWILWAIDDNCNQKVLYKKYIECNGGKLKERMFSPNGCFLAISSIIEKSPKIFENYITLITLGVENKNDYHEVILPINNVVTKLCFNSQSTVLAAGSSGLEKNNTITVWDTYKGTLLSSLSGHQNVVNIIQFNHNGTRMFSASFERTVGINILRIILWDTTDYTNIKQIKNHYLMGGVGSCHFSPDDTRIVVRMFDGDLIIFNGMTGETIKQFNHQFLDSRFSTVFSHNSRFLVSALLERKKDHRYNTFLYDIYNDVLLTIVVENQLNTCGAGFTQDKRHIITVASKGAIDGHHMINTTLFDEETHDALIWLKKGTSLIQKYALYRLYMQKHDSSKKFFLTMIDGQTDKEKKVKELIEGSDF